MSAYEDKGPFVKSRYLTQADLYEAMHKRIDTLEERASELVIALEKAEIALAKYKEETRVGSVALRVVRETLAEYRKQEGE